VIPRALRTLAFVAAAVPVGAAALATLIAGWATVSALAITPLVVPALVGYRWLVGGLVRLDGALANELLGTSVRPPYRSPGRTGYWRAAGNVLGDAEFWRQQAYLAVRVMAGLATAVTEISLLVSSLGLVALPVWYRWSDELVFSRHVHTLGDAFLWVPVGGVGLAVAVGLLRPLERLWRAVVTGLLGTQELPHSEAMARRREAVTIHAIVVGAIVALNVAIWALTSHDTFWPVWVMIGLGGPLAVHAAVYAVDVVAPRRWRVTWLHGALGLVLCFFLVAVWAAASRGYFWPAWPILIFLVSFTINGGVVYAQRRSLQRIAALEESRAGAVDQQQSELERIERDLHDGAQARLVALGMSLGMAQQKLASDPDGAQELLAEAQQGTREALEELRGLARGIRPPVLTERGLEAAIMALTDRTPMRVDVHCHLTRRPQRTVETAAYYVAAEAIANAGKHAEAHRVDVTIRDHDDKLLVEVMDDGVGGADAAGGGLRGLAKRVEALDGTLSVRSPAGGPTLITAVIPCAS
jgi:signal transduction histidine kinase